jgi:uncharacterized protein (TIRG00374 family)
MPNPLALILSIIFALAAYAAWVAYSGYDEVLAAAMEVGTVGMLIVCGLSVCNYLLRFLRWHWMILRMGHYVPFKIHLVYYLSGFALTTTPGKAGEIVRSVYLNKYNVDYKTSITTLFVERLLDVICIVLIASIALYNFEEYRFFGYGTVLFIGFVIAVILSKRALRMVRTFCESVVKGKLGRLVNHGVDVIDQSSELLDPVFFIRCAVIGLIAWGCEAFAFALIVDWIGSDISYPVLFGIYALSMLIGAASFLPGGLGSAEAAMGIMLVALAMGPSEAAAATIISRVSTLWFAVILGIFAIMYLEVKKDRTTEMSA